MVLKSLQPIYIWKRSSKKHKLEIFWGIEGNFHHYNQTNLGQSSYIQKWKLMQWLTLL